MPHLLFVSNPFPKITGADRDFLTLANSLDVQKWRITWAGSHGSAQHVRPLLKGAAVTRVVEFPIPLWSPPFHHNAYKKRDLWLWFKILARHWQYELPAKADLSFLLRGDTPDLVVTSTAAILSGALLARRLQIPHVWSVREWLDPEVAACRRFARWMETHSHTICVPSSPCADIFHNAQVVPDGSEISTIESSAQNAGRAEILARLELPENLPLVAQIGSVVPWKGAQITAQAFVQLAHSAPEPFFSLVFFGGGDENHRAHLETILADAPANWRSAVRFSSFPADDWSYVAAANLVVHPSILPDPLPNAVREAMILGKPVIASQEGGPIEMIRDGQTGILVAPRDANALADAMKKLLDAPAERARIGKAAREFAREFYDIERRKIGFETVFENAIGLASD